METFFKSPTSNSLTSSVMGSRSKIWFASGAAVIVVAAVFLGKTGLFKGNLAGSSFGGPSASVLVDSALNDTDFDGIVGDLDKCQSLPPYQIALFNKGNSLNYLGKIVKFSNTNLQNDGSTGLDFNVDGQIYSLGIGKPAFVAMSGTYPGFHIQELFASRTPAYGIVVIRRADVNLDNGCSAGR